MVREEQGGGWEEVGYIKFPPPLDVELVRMIPYFHYPLHPLLTHMYIHVHSHIHTHTLTPWSMDQYGTPLVLASLITAISLIVDIVSGGLVYISSISLESIIVSLYERKIRFRIP